MLFAKLHKAHVTEANIDYEGSIGIDQKLLDISGILPFEKVHVWDVTNGERLVTYVIEGKQGEISLNGAAAKKITKGHVVIISCFRYMNDVDAKKNNPKIFILDSKNCVKNED
jgi:aspartate 1-decarboxylase